MANDRTRKLVTRLPRPLRRTAELLDMSYEQWRSARTIRLGAGLAYYALFATVPLLTVAAALVGRLVSTQDAESFVADMLDGIVEVDADAIAERVVSDLGGWTGLEIVGFIALVVGASLFFLALQDALNVIWEAPVLVGLWNSMKRRLLAFGVSLVVAIYFISSFVVQAILGLAERVVPGQVELLESLAGLITTAGSWMLGVATLALLFRVLPYVDVRWRDALIGGAVTAILVALGTSLIGAYLSRYATTSLSGAASSVVLFLLWIYYQAQIILAGAVLTKVLGDRATAPGA